MRKSHVLFLTIVMSIALSVIASLIITTTSWSQSPYPLPATPNSPISGFEIYLPIVDHSYVPLASPSYYMHTTTSVYQAGCGIGTRDANLPGRQISFVFLDFGRPRDDGYGNYGTTLYNNTDISIGQIRSAVYIFAQGYWICLADDYDSFLTVGVGTNNSGTQVTYDHGVTWANLVVSINDWLGQDGYSTQVRAYGANNMEPGFNTASTTRNWVEGYESVNNRWSYYNIGSADGCPLDYPPTQPEQGYYSPAICNNNWTQEDVYYISWEALAAYPFPLIYEINGAHAQQWYRIGLYSKLSHDKLMNFRGTMTQYAACQQLLSVNDPRYDTDCISLDNTPPLGFVYLRNWINSDPYNRIIDELQWSTDIGHFGWP